MADISAAQWNKWLAARAAHKKAEAAMHDVLEQTFTPGKKVLYEHGSNVIAATVIEAIKFSEKLRVRSQTGKEYFIYAYRVM